MGPRISNRGPTKKLKERKCARPAAPFTGSQLSDRALFGEHPKNGPEGAPSTLAGTRGSFTTPSSAFFSQNSLFCLNTAHPPPPMDISVNPNILGGLTLILLQISLFSCFTLFCCPFFPKKHFLANVRCCTALAQTAGWLGHHDSSLV